LLDKYYSNYLQQLQRWHIVGHINSTLQHSRSLPVKMSSDDSLIHSLCKHLQHYCGIVDILFSFQSSSIIAFDHIPIYTQNSSLCLSLCTTDRSNRLFITPKNPHTRQYNCLLHCKLSKL